MLWQLKGKGLFTQKKTTANKVLTISFLCTYVNIILFVSGHEEQKKVPKLWILQESSVKRKVKRNSRCECGNPKRAKEDEKTGWDILQFCCSCKQPIVEFQIQAPSPNSEKDSMIMPCAIKSSFDKTGFHALSRRLFLSEFELSINLLYGDPSLYSMYSVQCKHRGIS
jgi:hypothetical protein